MKKWIAISAVTSTFMLGSLFTQAQAAQASYIDGYYTTQAQTSQSEKTLTSIGKSFTSSSIINEFPGQLKIVKGRLTANLNGVTFTFTPLSVNWGSAINEDGSLWRTRVTANKTITPAIAQNVSYNLYLILSMIDTFAADSTLKGLSDAQLEKAYELGQGNIEEGIYENPKAFPSYVGSFYPALYNSKNQPLIIAEDMLIYNGKAEPFQNGEEMPSFVGNALTQWLLST